MLSLKITWRYIVAFYCVIMLYTSLHELVHHFSGYFICGDWGIKTFNYFETACEDEKKAYIATYLGPIFSFVMMYVGMYFLNKNNSSYKNHLGFALIFAQLPLQRMISPFFRMNDEYYATAKLFGHTNTVYWSVIVIIWVACLPPIIKAFNAIENENKILWFIFYLALFPYLIWGPIFGGLEYLMVEKKFLAQPLIGIGLLFIINEIITIIAYYCTRKYINPHKESM
ncbi:MAG: hypothetical protein QNJ57_11670 [Flavobacteriaceae bacterium]|nr:hypothetical protein [Flavobacteriaceae bacterium]